MKNSILRLIVLSLLSLSLVSCEKEFAYPTNDLPANVPTKAEQGPTVDPIGTFKVIGVARVYKYNNAVEGIDSIVDISTAYCLEDSSKLAIDSILIGTTTWGFEAPVSGDVGAFILNGKYVGEVKYGGNYNMTQTIWTGGTARPYSGISLDVGKGIIGITICEVPLDNNRLYYTRLTLQKL